MEAIEAVTETGLNELDFAETTIILPVRGEFVCCDQCEQTDEEDPFSGVRSYGFFVLPSGKLLSFCAHHTQQYEEKLLAGGAEFAADYRDDLLPQKEIS